MLVCPRVHVHLVARISQSRLAIFRSGTFPPLTAKTGHFYHFLSPNQPYVVYFKGNGTRKRRAPLRSFCGLRSTLGADFHASFLRRNAAPSPGFGALYEALVLSNIVRVKLYAAVTHLQIERRRFPRFPGFSR